MSYLYNTRVGFRVILNYLFSGGGGGVDCCGHLKLMPHFLLICGVCMDAIDSNSGISFSERFKTVVTALKEQKSVSNRNAANVSECRYISCNLDSMNDKH